MDLCEMAVTTGLGERGDNSPTQHQVRSVQPTCQCSARSEASLACARSQTSLRRIRRQTAVYQGLWQHIHVLVPAQALTVPHSAYASASRERSSYRQKWESSHSHSRVPADPVAVQLWVRAMPGAARYQRMIQCLITCRRPSVWASKMWCPTWALSDVMRPYPRNQRAVYQTGTENW